MDQHLGRINLVSWQATRNRRGKSGMTPWTMILIGSAMIGLPLAAAQASGWLKVDGLLAVLPAGLILLVVGAQFVAGVRALLGWLGG